MPFKEVALDATRLWHERTGRPVGYVSGSPWFENATAFYSPDHPSAFAYFDYSRSLWVTPERIAKRGLLSICRAADAPCRADTTKFVTPETTQVKLAVAHTFWGHATRPEDFVVTIIPPLATSAGQRP